MGRALQKKALPTVARRAATALFRPAPTEVAWVTGPMTSSIATRTDAGNSAYMIRVVGTWPSSDRGGASAGLVGGRPRHHMRGLFWSAGRLSPGSPPTAER